MVMDFLQGGELFFHLRRRGLILVRQPNVVLHFTTLIAVHQEKEAQFYLAEMILAVEFLHNKGIIHR